MGVDIFKAEVEKRAGVKFATAKKAVFATRDDIYGWQQNHEGKWYFTVFIENGRVLDDEQIALKTALLEVAKTGKANFRFSCNQNVIISDVTQKDKKIVNDILEQFGIIAHTDNAAPLRKSAIACVAFNTCPLALAEAQRYLPTLISKIEPILSKYGLQEDEISLRMTGCPNGCGRSYIAEIGFIGTAYGQYNMHIGGDRLGMRLNIKYKENLDEPAILKELDNLFSLYSSKRKNDETFGDFVIREQLVKI